MTADGADCEFAPAKVNLTLHVTGRRADGYHLLDSLAVFAGTGDTLCAAPAEGVAMSVDGPMAAGLGAGEDNLVLRAARFLAAGDRSRGAALHLTKRLPLASGIGGGSADAAAALRLLARVWRVPLPDPQETATLGADVPVCLAGRPARMQGIGDRLSPLPPLPSAWLVLANPGVAVPTGPVFAALPSRENPPMPERLPALGDVRALADFLAACRNDLEAPAIALQPPIGTVLSALRGTTDCALARMSGSGGTCFGLFPGRAAAEGAARALKAKWPGWWIEAAEILS